MSDLQFSKVIEIISDYAPNEPNVAYQYGAWMRKRRQMQNRIQTARSFWHSPDLRMFSESLHSSLLVVKGTFQSRYCLRDVAFRVAEELHRKGSPILWAVQTGLQDRVSERKAVHDVLKSFVAQALRLCPPTSSEKAMAISCAQLHTTTSEKEWFDVLGSAIERLKQQVYILLDLEIIMQPAIDEQCVQVFELFMELFQQLSQRGVRTNVKVIVLTYRPITLRVPSVEEFSNLDLPTIISRPKPIQRRKRNRYDPRTAYSRLY